MAYVIRKLLISYANSFDLYKLFSVEFPCWGGWIELHIPDMTQKGAFLPCSSIRQRRPFFYYLSDVLNWGAFRNVPTFCILYMLPDHTCGVWRLDKTNKRGLLLAWKCGFDFTYLVESKKVVCRLSGILSQCGGQGKTNLKSKIAFLFLTLCYFKFHLVMYILVINNNSPSEMIICYGLYKRSNK